MVAWSDEEVAALPGIRAKAELNGYRETHSVDRDELRAREPHLGPGALEALEIPGERIVCPWTTTLAYATEAVLQGVELRLDTRVDDIAEADGLHILHTSRGTLVTRWLVNAAGLFADELDRKLGHDVFTVTPRRGELIVFDKLARGLVSHILLPVPTARGKGVLVAPTVYGNVLLGPTAEDLTDKGDTSSSYAGLLSLLDRGSRIVPALVHKEVTAIYAGLRAATESGDYRIRAEPTQRYVCVGGIRSTGLTASLAIAEHVLKLLTDARSWRPLMPSRPYGLDAGWLGYVDSDGPPVVVRLAYPIQAPPFWSIAWPVTPRASAESSQATTPAMSSGCDMRPSGTAFIASRYASSRVPPLPSASPSIPAHAISVSTEPGQIAFTWTFAEPSSAASERTSPSNPAFDAQ